MTIATYYVWRVTCGLSRGSEKVSRAVSGDPIGEEIMNLSAGPSIQLPKIIRGATEIIRVEPVNGLAEQGSGIKHISEGVVGQSVETGKARRARRLIQYSARDGVDLGYKLRWRVRGLSPSAKICEQTARIIIG